MCNVDISWSINVMWISVAGVLNSNIKMIKLNVITNVYHTGERVVVCTCGNKRMASVCTCGNERMASVCTVVTREWQVCVLVVTREWQVCVLW
jgi:hypothetical protein